MTTDAITAALDVIEAALDEQLDRWAPNMIWRYWIENTATKTRVNTNGRFIRLSGVEMTVPWGRRRRLRAAVRRWAARKAVEGFKLTTG